jgi:hypothetical protein
MGNYPSVPGPEHLDLSAGSDAFLLVCAGAAILFILLLILYFLLRGRSRP